MASVQKRVWDSGKVTYRVRWELPDRTEAGKSFTTRKAAKAYATKVEERIQRGIEFDPKAGAITFREAAKDWLATRSDLKASTLDGYRYALAPKAERRGDMRQLGIDAVFGGYPLNAIKRDDVQQWVNRMIDAGKKASTVRHAYWIVRMVLEQAVIDNRVPGNPADHVKLPTEDGNPGIVDDPNLFLSAAQVAALVAATPWPYNVYMHTAAWSGLRAAELCGLQIGDVDMPDAPALGALRVERTVRVISGKLATLPPKTKGSRRRVPLTAETTALLRDYLAEHPNAADPSAPLFPSMTLTMPRPSGVKAPKDERTAAERQAHALARLTVTEAQARLVLDWSTPLLHGAFYKAVYRPAVLRANRHAGRAVIPPALTFHALRHSYASLCVAAGIPTHKVSRFMGHSKPSTTETIYMHLFADDYADEMAALGGLARPHLGATNVVRLRR
ncbi:site-specific integrase [Mycobacterium colombiense]|uniref:Site-specific integrase n=1 Tax=Mycobacterium colombiense TaxID=339268 RepID=A0A329KES6_9MYCO|nr:tyrosine-type recombinase/integrase [Mycobacterium colombiense]RAU93500.1 site-specific integrase [Mycobacterium colombiense]